MLEPLLTLADLAERLGRVSVKTARRRLADAMKADPGLHAIRAGRTILFTEATLERILKALQWRCITASEARSGTAAAPSASAGKRTHSPSSPQAALASMMRERLERRKKPPSAGTRLRVLPGGRAAAS